MVLGSGDAVARARPRHDRVPAGAPDPHRARRAL